MLSYVCKTQAWCLPDGTLSWHLLTHQDLDGGGFSCAVGTDDSNTADLRHRQVDIEDGRLVLRGVLEAHIGHAEDHLAAALHTLKSTWLWESESHSLIAELKVCFLFWVFLHELGQALALHPLEGLQLAVLEV